MIITITNDKKVFQGILLGSCLGISSIMIPSRIEKRNICDISYIFRPLNMHHILVRIEIGNTTDYL